MDKEEDIPLTSLTKEELYWTVFMGVGSLLVFFVVLIIDIIYLIHTP